MKLSIAFCCSLLVVLSVYCQRGKVKKAIPDATQKIQVVETACGQCKFGLAGKGCDLAVKINDTAYYVDGTTIDDHGDAHAKEGFCNAIRKAEVQGMVVNNRFKATYFKLLPALKKRG